MKLILKYRFLLWFFFLCLLYAGCTVGLWALLNSSYVFLDVQRIIQGNSVQYCSSPSQLRFPSAITVKGERCSLRASWLPVSQPHCVLGMAHGRVLLLRSQGKQLGPCALLGLVHGHVNISCLWPWCNAIKAVLPRKPTGPWWVGMLAWRYHHTGQVWGVIRWGFCRDSALPSPA